MLIGHSGTGMEKRISIAPPLFSRQFAPLLQLKLSEASHLGGNRLCRLNCFISVQNVFLITNITVKSFISVCSFTFALFILCCIQFKPLLYSNTFNFPLENNIQYFLAREIFFIFTRDLMKANCISR